MTNPRDDLMALAGRLDTAARILAKKPCEVYRLQQDCEIAAHAIRLAASRPATQVVDREAVARALCESGKFETGEGTCSLLCMDQLGSVRKKGCNHLTRVHGKLADAILSLLRPAEPVEAKQRDTWSAAKHDEIIKRLMEQIGMPNSRSLYQAFKQFANELHHMDLGASATAPQPTTPDAVVEPVAWRLRTTNGSSHNYCHVVTDGELEIWKHNWASHLAQGTAVLEPLYTHPPAQPDINAAVLQERERCAAWHDTMVARWQQHYDNWKRRDNDEGMGRCEMHMNIHSHAAAAIRQLPTPERDGES